MVELQAMVGWHHVSPKIRTSAGLSDPCKCKFARKKFRWGSIFSPRKTNKTEQFRLLEIFIFSHQHEPFFLHSLPKWVSDDA